MRRLLAALMFLMFVNDARAIYARQMFAPFMWVEDALFSPLPIKVRPFDIIVALIFVIAGSKGPRVMPLRNTILLAVGTTVAWFALGLARGGDVRAASWQVYLMLAMPLAAFTIAATHPKAAHFIGLAKVIIAAAFYRVVMCLTFYVSYVRNSGVESPSTMTTHDDTVLWVVAITILIINVLQNRTRLAKAGAYFGIPLIILAIQFNNRRLAWVSLGGSLAAFYFLLPPSAPKRRLKRVASIMVPILALYVAIGWGRSEKIFKPVAAFSSVSAAEDSSTLARNVENLSLIATANKYSTMTGTGWGHAYYELSYKYSIAEAFELWPYVPHNSVLGLFAYTGLLGVIGYWMMLPTTVFFHARTARLAKDPALRSAGIIGVTTMVVCCNQLFGDMGMFSSQTMYMIAMCMAAAMRVPIEAGVWPGKPATAKTKAPAVATAQA